MPLSVDWLLSDAAVSYGGNYCGGEKKSVNGDAMDMERDINCGNVVE